MARWRLGRATVALAVVGLWVGPATAPSRAEGPDPRAAEAEAEFVDRIAAERAARGLGALTLADDLTAVARRHAARMAAEGRLYHNPDLATEVSGYRVVGENVGDGGSAAAIHDAFMASATHRRQILRPGYRDVGVGVVWSGELLWVSEVFREPADPPPAPAPTQPPATRPVASGPPARVQAPPPPAPPPATAPTGLPPPPGPPPAIATERLSATVPSAVGRPEVAGARIAASGPVPAGVPPPAAAATALLIAVVALQHAAVRRLGLVGHPGGAASAARPVRRPSRGSGGDASATEGSGGGRSGRWQRPRPERRRRREPS